MDNVLTQTLPFDTFELNVPKVEVDFFKTFVAKMGWTFKNSAPKTRIYDPETGEYLNDKTVKVIEDAMNGKGIAFRGSFEEFKAMAEKL